MRAQDSLWQGSFGYWQNTFICQYLPAIGYTAWDGFLTIGRGVVASHVTLPIDGSIHSIDWFIDSVECMFQFIPEQQFITYLQRLDPELVQNSEVWNSKILGTIATYDPAQEIVVVVIGNHQIDINLLQHLAISPAACWEQVRHRWNEFQSCLKSPEISRFNDGVK